MKFHYINPHLIIAVFSLLIVPQAQSTIITHSTSFEGSSASTFATTINPVFNTYSKFAVLPGFDSSLGELTAVNMTFDSNYSYGSAISAWASKGGYTATGVAANKLEFWHYSLGDNQSSRFEIAAQNDNLSTLSQCSPLPGSFTCFASNDSSGEYNGNLDLTPYTLDEFYDNDLSLLAVRKATALGSVSGPGFGDPSIVTSFTGYNAPNSWSGVFETTYTYDPFASLNIESIELSNTPKTLFVSDNTGNGGLVASIEGGNSNGGVLSASFTNTEESTLDFSNYDFDGFNFALPGSELLLWDIAYDGSLIDSEIIKLLFEVDLTGYTQVEIDNLDLYHFEDDDWHGMNAEIMIGTDPKFSTITAYTSTFSPFAVGVSFSTVPEPSTILIFMLGIAGLALTQRRNTLDS